MDGKLVVDDSGAPILSEDCPCGDCCEQLVKWIVSQLSQTVETCQPCDQGDGNENCGECSIVETGQSGYWVNKARNPIMSFDTGQTGQCNSGFTVTSPPQDGNAYQEGEPVTVKVCDSTATVPFSYTDAEGVVCQQGDGCWQFVKMFCEQGDKLYPAIPAPDSPDLFSRPSTKCKQEYWVSCFDPEPVSFFKCAAQVIAPRYMFDDWSGQTQDDTLVWGVVGCCCEGNGKWKIRKYCGGTSGNGLIIVDAPFTPETTTFTDDKGNTSTVPVCGITCQGQKDLVEEMVNHYAEHLTGPRSGIRATTDVDQWNSWTGDTVQDACFWGYVPLSAVYVYVCDHDDDQGNSKAWIHYVMFDCDCNMTEEEQEKQDGDSLCLCGSGMYPSDVDLCDAECPDLWALMAYSKGRGWSRSHAQDSDPRGSADEGVIITKDSRLPNGSIYTIGGSATFFAAWGTGDWSTSNQDYLIWIDCDCHAHVECITDDSKKFLKYEDACTCLDWREVVDDNAAVFGVTEKSWGSHSIVQWTHSTSSASYEGPYWLYNGSSDNHTWGDSSYPLYCEECPPRTTHWSWTGHYNSFIDWNMLVVKRVVNGYYEIGHVQKAGGVVNYRLNQSGAAMTGISGGSVPGTYPELCGDQASAACPSGGFAGWYMMPNYFNLYAMHNGSIECSCDPDPWDLPICTDHSRRLSIDTIFADSPSSYYRMAGCPKLEFTPRKSSKEGVEVHNCDGSCNWQPGTDYWALFCVPYIRTSCGLMIVNSNGNHFYIPSFTVPGYAGSLATNARNAIIAQYGWCDETMVTGSYPYSDTTISATYPNNAQPALCHKTQCGGYQQYSSFADYCDKTTPAGSTPSDECLCYKTPTSSECNFLN